MKGMHNQKMKGLYIKTAPFGKGSVGGSITHTMEMIDAFVENGVDLTVLSTNEIDPCKANVVILPVVYNRRLPHFIRDIVYYRDFNKKIMEWSLSLKQISRRQPRNKGHSK